MPFVARKIEPRYLCRGHVPTGPGAARDWPVAAELEAAAHGALTGALKQLASLLGAAEDVFAELTAELTGIAERGAKLRIRIDRVEARLAQQDPKKIPVPESDICTFALRTEHFKLASSPSRCLFTLDTRPKALRQLYEAAAAVAVRSLDSLRRDRDATSSIDMFMCTPILGKRRRDHSLDIESRVPRAIEELRRWTSAEALGDVTVTPDCTSRITMAESLDDSRPVDHKLPSPEEQLQAIALKFPAEIVAVDVSGRGFQRMSMRRRSMHTGQDSHETVKRRSRPRRPRGKRRNTIAGTDQKEIRQAVGGETTADEPEEAQTSGAGSSSTSKRAHRSASTDLLGSGSKKDSPVEKKSHFDTLKAWGRSRLKLISPKSSQQHAESNGSTTLLSSPSSEQTTKSSRHSGLLATEDEIRSAEETVVGYETPMGSNRRPRREQSGKSSHERKASSSSSSGKSVSSQQQQQLQQQKQQQLEPSDGAATTESQPSLQPSPRQAGGSVRLRESAAERRERRKARADEPPHSSSGNWSASSESGRASIGSETTTTTHPPKSTTTASIGTSSTSLSHARRFKGRDTSASSSVTSEGTLTPDIIQDINAVPFSDDGETSSVYSCDTEGYYTSFHMDSGLKTLREEELPAQPQSPLTKSNEVQSDPTSPIAENEYELYGRGSTSTTTSSAGTVCTTLMAPPPPERKSSLTVVAMVHGQKQNGGESPDSGHNTSSSPVESASSPACTGRSCSEFEYSESSDLEGCERIERIRSKTAINTSRIPSMCVITPPGSDDENQQKDAAASNESKDKKKESQQGAVLMSATVGTSKMEVINGQDKNLYATVQTVMTSNANSNEKGQVGQNIKISPLSGVLGKLRGVLPGRKHQQKPNQEADYNNHPQSDSGDYVTIADVRNNNDKRTQDNTTTPTTIRPSTVTYANADIFKRDAEYVSLSELPKKPDSSLERRRQGARVTLDSEGKVVYSSDSLKRRKGAHTTFIPGPFVKEGPSSPAPSPLLHRAQITPRAVQRTAPDAVDGEIKSVPEPIAQQQQQQQHGKVIIRAAKSPDRSVSPDYVRTPSTVVGPSSCSAPLSVAQRQSQRQGAYVNVQGASEEEKALLITQSVPPSPCGQKSQSQNQPHNHHHNQQQAHKQHQNQPQQPPPYVGPPQVHVLHKGYPYPLVYDNRHHPNPQLRQGLPQLQAQHAYHQQQQQPLIHHIIDPYQQMLIEKNSLHRQSAYSNYTENQKIYAHQPIQNCDKAQQQQHFYTLPNRRAQREVIVEPPRSITPDITRGLGRGPLSAMHMLARQGQKSGSAEKLASHHYHAQPGYNCQMDLNRKASQQLDEPRCKPQRQQAPVDVKNRFASPPCLSSLGYRFFASPLQDSLRSAPISPIGPEHANGFKSSTPTSGRSTSTPSVAERLALQSQRCASPNPALMRHGSAEKLVYSSDSGRSTPTNNNNNPNIILSPIKSTMSNEELFAAIHKSKKRLNIREDPESLSPANSLTSLSKSQQAIGTRHSWSPESQRTPEIPKSVLSPSQTSRLDFKRLLLQQSIKSGPNRISAAEQLKLSRQQCQESQQLQQQHPPSIAAKPGQQTPLTKVLSPRSAWRFQTPRTDVLSSTIIEDTAAEEKAMKPSPENPSPVSKLPPLLTTTTTTIRRQLDLSNERSSSKNLEELKNVINDNKNQRTLEKREKELENRLQAIDLEDAGETARKVQSDNSELDNPIKAIESRRMSNQLARAQFLASAAPASAPGSHKDLFNRRFRARSESPQQNDHQRSAAPSHNVANAVVGTAVTRSPSAPTLETAL